MTVPSWSPVRIGDVADLEFGFAFKSAGYTSQSEAPRLLRGDNIAQGTLRWDGCKRWPADQCSELGRYKLAPGDVVLAMDRPWIEAGLKYAAVGVADLPALLVQRVARLRGTPSLDVRFLKFVIGSPAFTNYVVGVQTGTAVPHISGGQIRDFRFVCPPLAEQQRIAAILGALDDKIEANRCMNETLEELVRIIFKSWFVDFDPVRAKSEGRPPAGVDAETAALFPSRLLKGEFGETPQGWTAQPLYDLASYVNGAAYRDFHFCAPSEGLPIVKIVELKAGVTGQTRFTNTVLDERYRIDTGAMLFSWSGNPDTSIDTFIWTRGPAWLNQHIFKVVPRKPNEAVFLFRLLRHLRPVFAEIARNKQTTGLGHVTAADMKRLNVTVPSESVLDAFDRTVGPMHARWFGNLLESQTLAELRDLLLPKLISGELRVPAGEKMVEAAL